jgi:hypothetical protein
MGWMIGRPNDKATLTKLQQEVFSVVLIDDADNMTIIGSAFIVSKIGSNAICLSASHVFEEIHRLTRHNITDFLPHIPSNNQGVVFDITDLMEARKVKVLSIINGEPFMCDIVSISVQPPLDTTLILIEEPIRSDVSFSGVLGLNSDPLAVGTEIILVSYRKQEVARVGDGAYSVYREPSIRIGKILSTDYIGSPLVKAPVYTTNIPCDPGMSGGPVFIYDPKMKDPKKVCGVISSDMSPAEAFTNCKIDGHSYISHIWPAAVHGVRDQDNRFVTLKELAAKGYVVDYGSALDRVKIEVLPDGKWQLGLI